MDDIINRLDSLIEIPRVTGVYCLSPDGFILDSIFTAGNDPDQIGAISAIVASTSASMGSGLEMGSPQKMLLEFKTGKALFIWISDVVWVIITSPNMIVGEVLSKARIILADESPDLV